MTSLTLCLIFSLVIISVLYIKTKDIFNPCICFLGIILCKYIIPGILQFFSKQTYYNSDISSFNPLFWHWDSTFSLTGFYVFIFLFFFVLFYFLSDRYSFQKEIQLKITEPKPSVALLSTIIGFGSLAMMYPLFIIKIQGGDPYYHMKGLGFWAQIYGILGYTLSFLLIASQNNKVKLIGFLNAIISLFYWGIILNRKTNTIMYLLGLGLVLYNPFKNKSYLNYKDLMYLFGSLFIALAIFIFSKQPHELQQLNEFVMFDLGRFDIFWGFLSNTHESFTLSPKYLLKQAPYSGYIPYIKELGRELSLESQTAIIGHFRHKIGGIPFVLFSKAYYMGGVFGLAFFGSLNGFLWNMIYKFSKMVFQENSNMLLGLYAIYWSNNVGVNLIYFGSPVFIGLALFFLMGGKFSISRRDQVYSLSNASYQI